MAREAIERLARMLPPSAKAAGKRLAAPADAVYRRRHARRTGGPPVPPLRLRTRIGAGVSIPVFLGTGAQTARVLKETLQAHGRSFTSARSVLDFGCGCGRVLGALLGRPDLLDPARTRVHGCDVDAEAIEWCRRALPAASFAVNGFAPPLPYADGAFDVVFSSSIFTHLTEAQQDVWLAEIDRVLAGDGVALLTVAGPEMFRAMRDGRLPSNSRDFSRRLRTMPDLDAQGFVFEPYVRTRWNRRDLPEDAYGCAYHSAAYVERRWGRTFGVLQRRAAVTNHLQDLVVLAKREPAGVAR